MEIQKVIICHPQLDWGSIINQSRLKMRFPFSRE